MSTDTIPPDTPVLINHMLSTTVVNIQDVTGDVDNEFEKYPLVDSDHERKVDEYHEILKQPVKVNEGATATINHKHNSDQFTDPKSWEIIISTIIAGMNDDVQLENLAKLENLVQKLVMDRPHALYLSRLDIDILAFDGGLEFLNNLGFDPDFTMLDRWAGIRVDNRIFKACLTSLKEKIAMVEKALAKYQHQNKKQMSLDNYNTLVQAIKRNNVFLIIKLLLQLKGDYEVCNPPMLYVVCVYLLGRIVFFVRNCTS